LLRIVDHSTKPKVSQLKVSGRLVENWAIDFEQSCLRYLKAGKELIVCIDELTFADQAGVAAVARLNALGVKFVGGTTFLRERLKLHRLEN
jgi:hypothetical protein